jgi:two-component sensor histidine kinase
MATAEVFDQHATATHRDDVALVAQELMTNAIRHGAEPVRLVVTASTEETFVAVFDAGSGRPVAEPQQGHGLQIVDVLSASWGTDVTQTGKWVWAALR